MLVAKIRKSALAFVMAGLAVTTPAALAEKADVVDDHHYGHASVMLNACIQPDDTTLKAVVPVSTDHGSHATGVVIDRNKVLTAAHAVVGGKRFYINVAGTVIEADLAQMDRVRDLAVLRVDTQGVQPLRIIDNYPSVSQPVWAVGYPRAQAITTSTGVIQEHHRDSLHSSASIDSGQSGGGLLGCSNGNWALIGMLRGYGAYRQGDRYVKIKNHSVSVAAAAINQFLHTN